MSRKPEPSKFAATTLDSQAGDAGVASYGYLGRYRLDYMIGHGAMGAVFEAFDATLGRTIAIKTLYTQPDQTLGGFDSDVVDAAILQEARAAATLNHPHIVTVYDAGRAHSSMLARELPYVAMELLQGTDLRQRIAQGPKLNQREAVALVGKLALALDHAHKAGVIHRDIKPANVFLSKTNGPKILDFGLAKFTTRAAHNGQSTHGDMVAGSPQYMSPEMLRSSIDPLVKPDARSDVYSLGVILYELLCGKPPFVATTLEQLQERIAHGAPDVPYKINATISRELSDIMLQALAKKPDDRYRSAGQLARELRRWGAQSPEVDETTPKPAVMQGKPTLASDADTAFVQPGSARPTSTQASAAKNLWLGAGSAAALALAILAWLWQERQIQVLAPTPTQVMATSAAQINTNLAYPPTAQAAAVSASPTAPLTPSSSPSALEISPASTLSPGESISPDATSADAASSGTLRINIAPWGKVEVDGKNMGVSPPLTLLALAPGQHTVIVRNADFAAKTFQINIESGKTQKIIHKFE